MKLFARCLRRQVLFHLALVFLSIALFIFFLTLSVQFKFVRHDYGAWHAAIYAFWVLPVNIYALFPWFFLMGWWLAFYRMHASGLLLHCYASGMTPRHVFRCLWGLCLLVVVIATMMGEGLGPVLERHAKRSRMQAMMDYQIEEDAAALWLREPDGFIEAHRSQDPGVLESIRRYRFEGGTLASIEWIPYARYQGHYWRCASGYRVWLQGVPKYEGVAEQEWRTRLTPELLSLSQSGYLKTPLYHMRSFMKAGALGLVGKKEMAAFWGRVFLPVKLVLWTMWLSAYASRLCLWRVASHTIFHSAIGVLLWVLGDAVWKQIALKLFYVEIYWAELFSCVLLLYFIYRTYRATMVDISLTK